MPLNHVVKSIVTCVVSSCGDGYHNHGWLRHGKLCNYMVAVGMIRLASWLHHNHPACSLSSSSTRQVAQFNDWQVISARSAAAPLVMVSPQKSPAGRFWGDMADLRGIAAVVFAAISNQFYNFKSNAVQDSTSYYHNFQEAPPKNFAPACTLAFQKRRRAWHHAKRFCRIYVLRLRTSRVSSLRVRGTARGVGNFADAQFDW
jgi:hypothetical protein